MFEVISGIIGVCGFILSVINLIIHIESRKKKLRIYIDYFDNHPQIPNAFALRVRFDNLSELPITVTDVTILNRRNVFRVFPVPVLVGHSKLTQNDEIIYENKIQSDIPPINLAPLQSAMCCFVFQPRSVRYSVKE